MQVIRRVVRRFILAAGLLPAGPVIAADQEAIAPDAARAVFGEAKALCERDAGRLWGVSLCAPIMLVDPGSRMIAASQADAAGVLQAEDGIFVGRLPESDNMANTAVEWSGTRWTQMTWPLPKDPHKRAVLVAHELFHNLQPRLGMRLERPGDNVHLDAFEGRYWLQLEWRALAAALQAQDERSRRRAVWDALAFRQARHAAFVEAGRTETALELNEGLAEYTGVVVAGATDAERTESALRDLSGHVADTSFVRSFAYATGPAYGLLLDRYAPGWRKRLAQAAGQGRLVIGAAGASDGLRRQGRSRACRGNCRSVRRRAHAACGGNAARAGPAGTARA